MNSNLNVALGDYGNIRALKDGRVTVPGINLDFVEVAPVHEIFRRMIQEQSFDIAEMSLMTYILAREFGKPVVALPVTPVRMFHHGTIWRNTQCGIRHPKDLEGRRVGVRSYAQTGPTWSRGVLQSEYGVDLASIKWVTFENSHVPEVRDPLNALRAPVGKTLAGMLASGEIDAALSLENLGAGNIEPLFSDAQAIELQWFRKTGIFPVNHLVVLRGDLAKADAALPRKIYSAFKEAKDIYLDELALQGPRSAEDASLLRLQEMVQGDPLPYGVEKNRRAIDAMAHFAFEQGLVPKQYSVETLFDPLIRSVCA